MSPPAWLDVLITRMPDTTPDARALTPSAWPPDGYDFTQNAARRRELLINWLRHDDGSRLRDLALYPRASLTLLRPALPTNREWSAVADLVDAGYRACEESKTWTQREQVSLRAHLARLRYYVLTAPFRSPEPDLRDLESWRSGFPDRVVAEARQARDDWVAVLDTRDDRLALLRTIEVDDDLNDLTRAKINKGLLNQAGRGSEPDDGDRSVWRHVARHHLLPRFALPTAAATAWRMAGPWLHVALVVALVCVGIAAAAVLAGALGLPSLAGRSWFTLSTLAAAVGYGLVAVAAAVEPATSWPWLLRQPASSAVGLLVLATVSPAWWLREGEGDADATLWATVGLLLAGTAYLVVEAANHGVRGRALYRPLLVAGVGVVHALLVAELMLRFLFPVVAEHADVGGAAIGTAGWWHDSLPPGQLRAWELLAFATAWGFAAGVGGQILWDDQPVTAPLSHLTWRLGGNR